MGPKKSSKHTPAPVEIISSSQATPTPSGRPQTPPSPTPTPTIATSKQKPQSQASAGEESAGDPISRYFNDPSTVDISVPDGPSVKIPLFLFNWMKAADSPAEMRGRLRIFTEYLFLETRNIPAEHPKLYLEQIQPDIFKKNKDETLEQVIYFSRQINTSYVYIKKIVEAHVKRWYKSDAAKWWKQHYDEQEELDNFAEFGSGFPYPKSIRDLMEWNGHKGFEFNYPQTVDFWKRFIQHMELHKDQNSAIGWLTIDTILNDYLWYRSRRSIALRIVLNVIQVMGPTGGSKREIDLGVLKAALRAETYELPTDALWPLIHPKFRESAATLFKDSTTYPKVSLQLALVDDIHFYDDDAKSGRALQEIDYEEDVGDLLDPRNPQRGADHSVVGDLDMEDEDGDSEGANWFNDTKDAVDFSVMKREFEEENGPAIDLAHKERTTLTQRWNKYDSTLARAKVLKEYRSHLVPIEPDTVSDDPSNEMVLAGRRWACGNVELKVALTDEHVKQFCSAVEQEILHLTERKDALIVRNQVLIAKEETLEELIALKSSLHRSVEQDEAALNKMEKNLDDKRASNFVTRRQMENVELPPILSLRRKRQPSGNVAPSFIYLDNDARTTSVFDLGLPNSKGEFGSSQPPPKRFRQSTTGTPASPQIIPDTPVKPRGGSSNDHRLTRQSSVQSLGSQSQHSKDPRRQSSMHFKTQQHPRGGNRNFQPQPGLPPKPETTQLFGPSIPKTDNAGTGPHESEGQEELPPHPSNQGGDDVRMEDFVEKSMLEDNPDDPKSDPGADDFGDDLQRGFLDD
ncbi:hypothetical protein BJ508DRAFT_300503 [Ascobolus immersus RN42]|uniref:Uncharacterized protein n=1 Tax=Ascobolus immersus RN42 TaxID=1160509 RepID=A0A3N4IPL9_ASCIM|nr:hypothetical protein BJ508DRAFT_300503 [Ascobolus immersus RN42]